MQALMHIKRQHSRCEQSCCVGLAREPFVMGSSMLKLHQQASIECQGTHEVHNNLIIQKPTSTSDP